VSRGLRRLLDHRCGGAAVTHRATAARALDDRTGVGRRRCVSTNRAAGTGAALDDRAVSSRVGRAVLGWHATRVDLAATSERGTFLAEDLAVGAATGAGGQASTAGSTSRRAAAEATRSGSAAARLAAQPGATGNRWSRMGSQRIAVATQDGARALAADAQSSAACSARASLATNTDTAKRT